VEDSTKAELIKLIRNEIDLGFTFTQTFRLSSATDHSSQALRNAQHALN
jgi:hypothetical protein